MSNIVDRDGNEIVRMTVPVIEHKGTQLSLRRLLPEVMVNTDSEKGVRPSDIIRELRATQACASDNGTMLLYALVVLCNEGIEGLRGFLSHIDVRIEDLNKKVTSVIVDDAHPVT